MRKLSLSAFISVVVVSAGLAFVPGTALASSTVVVTGPDVGTVPTKHWGLASQAGAYTTGFVTGPAVPPAGAGSLRLSVTGATGHISVYNYDHGVAFAGPDVMLSDIDALGYSTYRDGSSTQPGVVPSYNIEIDPDGPSTTSGFSTLVWEPANNGGGIVDNTWQTWDAYNGGAGIWWSTQAIPGVCAVSCYVPWSTIVANNPNATVKFGLGPNLGSGLSGFSGNVDALKLGVSGNTTTYDFEPAVCTTVCYVDGVHGDDNNGGTAPADAKKTIQAGVNAVTPGGTVNVAAATYTEQVTIIKALTLTGAGSGVTTVQAPGTLADSTCLPPTNGKKAIVDVCAPSATVTMSGFKVSGPGPGTCNSLHYGIAVTGAATLNLSSSTVTKIRDEPLGGCQNGVGILAGRSANSTTGTLNATGVTVTDYQKGGIVFDNAGSGGSVTSSVVTGVGNTSAIAQNGVQVSGGATATLTGNTISGNQCDHPSCGPDSLTQTQDAGVLLFQAGAGTVVSSNNVNNNDIGVYNFSTGAVTINSNTVANNRFEGIFLDEGTANVTNNDVGAVSNIGVMAVSFTGAAGNSTGTLTGNNIHGTGVAVQVIDDDLSDSFIPDVSGMSNQLAGNFYGIDNQTAKNLLFKKNWWGSATGPSDWSIGTGTGVSQNVRFFPWSTNAASTTFQVCTIVGTNSPDTLNGTAGNDIMCGKGADDTLNGLGGNDLLIGDAGNDILVGGPGDDAILGTSGNDTLKGGQGNDSLQGGPGTDTCQDPNPFHFATCENGP
ncbi:MAG: hypothetical protein E6G06_16450 [Actinobacteria bacterium]|nr:MAG: hypothetical protein E6G06_16450 [Actinomycetota bacterium]